MVSKEGKVIFMWQRTSRRMARSIRRYWILLLVLAFGLLSIYTSHPIYGAPAATPTPDVNTVPAKPVDPTPENTPFPTPTAISNDTPSGGGGAPGQDENNADNNNTDDNNTDGNNSDAGNGASTGDNNSDAGAPTDTADEAADFEPSKATGITGVVTAVTLNLRKEAKATAHVIDTLFLNDEVTILGRNQNGDWWYVCCGARTQLAGWVSKQFVSATLNSAEAMTVIPLAAGAEQTASATAPTGTLDDGSLLLEMRPLPSFAWQGQTIAIQFVVRNRSQEALSDVQLRSDLPAELAVVTAETGSQGEVTYTGARENGPIFTIDWPALQANGQVTATVTVKVATDVADGALIDSLAVVKTTQGAEALAGITLAMPPVVLPQFR